MERCKHCDAEIYWNYAAHEWRHYGVIAEHRAEPA